MIRTGYGIGLIFGLILWAALAVSAADAANWDAVAVGKALSNGQPKEALSAIRARLADHPDDPQVRFLEAMALAETGRPGDAVSIFETLSARYPDRARIANNLGVLYARQGRLDKARAALIKAVASAPDYAQAQENLGDVYVALADSAYRRAGQRPGASSSLARKQHRISRLVPSLPEVSVPSGSSSPQPAATSVPQQASAVHGKANSQASDGVNDQIDQVLTRWAKARSAQNVSAYLAAYSDDYQPAGDTSLADWIRRQRARFQRRKSVDVSVRHLEVQRDGNNRADATFSEHYRTAQNERDASRQMIFVREDGNWRIEKES